MSQMTLRHVTKRIPTTIQPLNRFQSTQQKPQEKTADALNNESKVFRSRPSLGIKSIFPTKQESPIDISQAKAFKDIPGPFALPILGTSYLYVLGVYDKIRRHHAGYKKFLKYGPLVREEILPGVNLLSVYDADDMETIFRHDSRFPGRRSHLAVKKFREDRPEVYNTGGLLPTNDEEWWRLRKEFQKGLSAPQCVRAYLPATDAVIRNFVNSRLEGSHEDFLPELSRLFLDLTCLVAFDVNMDSFSSQEMKSDSRSTRLMDAALTTNSLILPLDDNANAWKDKDTPDYEKIKKAMLYMEEVAVELVNQKASTLADKKKDENAKSTPSLLELYLENPALDIKDVVGMSVDMLLAGIDTTTYTASFALYHLAKSSHAQKQLRLESYNLLGSIEKEAKCVTSDMLAHAPYARAVLKEVFRMNPIAFGVGRVLNQDLVLSGYHIPTGTIVVTQNQVASRLPRYFSAPDYFIPERWIKGHKMQVTCSPYVVLPFGHGPRSCIARRLAEQHLLTLILRVVQKFEIEWKGVDFLDCHQSFLINKPDAPVALSFKKIA